MEPDNELFTPREAADFLKVNVRTIYRWVKNGTIASTKIAGTLRIRKADLDNLFQE